MKIHAALLLTSIISLVACVPNGMKNYEAHDVLLYGLGERQIFFYGQSDDATAKVGEIKLGQDVLALSHANIFPQNNSLVLPGSLAVNDQPSLKLSPRNIGERFNLAKVPLSEDVSLLTRESVQGVLYFDGRNWFDVSGPTNADQKLRLVPSKRDGLRGIGQLNDAEAVALQNYLKPQGEMAVALLPNELVSDAAIVFDPAPSIYRRTALIVQKGVPVDVLAALAPRPSLQFKLLASAINSGYEKEKPALLIDRDRLSFERTWAMIGSNQLPAPSAPAVDFKSYRVVSFFMGQKATGGYSVKLNGAKLQADTLVLDLNLSQPKPDSLSTQAFTSPYISVLIGSEFKRVNAVDHATGKVVATAP